MSTHDLPPGPRWPTAVQTTAWWTRSVPFLERCRARYGKTFTIRLAGVGNMVMFAQPDDIKAIFTAPPEVLHPGEGSAILEPIVGSNSILLLDEERHMSQRKLVLPAFHGEKMAALSGVIAEVAEAEIAAWPLDRPMPLHPRMQALTLEVILRALFGLDRGERLDSLRRLLAQMLEFGTNPISLLPQLQRLGRAIPSVARFNDVRAETDAQIQGLIDDRRAAKAAGETGDDVLSLMLDARHEDGTPMSDIELRDELMTLLVAGHETTATELSWAFERLVRNPEVLARLTAEVDAGGSEYVTATVRETLRRRPVLPIAAPRRVVESFEVGGRIYGPGTHLALNAYLVQHDREIYPDPYAFRPERFLDAKPGTYTWIPFGGGRRRCIGASFAMLEMELVLAALLRRAEVRPVDGSLELNMRRMITVSPSAGARTVLHERRPAAHAQPNPDSVAA